MKFYHKQLSGFTIVEVLIVIVVIAILAAITVIAYNGITTRAENTKTINSVSEYVKVLKAYAAEKGEYPNSTSCLGPAGTKCSNTSQNSPTCFGSSQVNYNANFVNAISSIATSLPAPSTQTMSCGGDMYGGVFYQWLSTQTRILYYLKGNQDCSAAGANLVERLQQGDATRCVVRLPAL